MTEEQKARIILDWMRTTFPGLVDEDTEVSGADTVEVLFLEFERLKNLAEREDY